MEVAFLANFGEKLTCGGDAFSPLKEATMRKHFLCSLWLVALLLQSVAAAPLETSFFSLEVPDAWTFTRNPSGLWQLTAPGPDPLEILVSVARLNTTPELYLKGTEKVWSSLGSVERLQPWLADRADQAWFLVKHSTPGQEHLATVKWVRWRGSLLVVTSFRAPRAQLKAHKGTILAVARGLKLERPEFDQARLVKEVELVLHSEEDDAGHLKDPDGERRRLSIARQDWEPFFLNDQPALYQAYRDYLTARFDAAFAIVNGSELGIGPDMIESRLTGVANRRQELKHQLDGS